MDRPASMQFEVPSATQRTLGLWVEAAGVFRMKPAAWPVLGRRLQGYRLLSIEQGSGWLETPLVRRVAVPPRSMVLLFPGLVHSYAPDTAWSERWLDFTGPLAEAFEHAGFVDRRQPVLPLPPTGPAATQLDRVFEALQGRGPLAGELAAARVHELLVRIHELRLQMGKDAGDDLVARAIAWLDARLPCGPAELGAADPARAADGPLAELRPESVARALGVGYSTLRRRFKRETGFSIKEYILSAQLRRAKELLVRTSEPVEAIADRVGFQDAFYFSRLFRSREGVSPSAFRDRRERGPAAVAIVRRRSTRGPEHTGESGPA